MADGEKLRCLVLGALIRDEMNIVQRYLDTSGKYLPNGGIEREGLKYNMGRLDSLFQDAVNSCELPQNADIMTALVDLKKSSEAFDVRTASLRDKWHLVRNELRTSGEMRDKPPEG